MSEPAKRYYKTFSDNMHLQSENARLKAEVERLTQAGDELHVFLISYIVENRISSSYLDKLENDWYAAKEGKPRD
jgi:hypothetical protein